MTARTHRFARRAALALFSGGALALLTAVTPAKPLNWSATVSVSPIGAHIVGNPAAKVRLVEYLSYTCGTCGEFDRAGGAPLKAQYVDPGLVAVEYRNFVRDPVDMTAALLGRCGGPKAFAGNHRAILAAQPDWLAKVQKATDAQVQSWYQGSVSARARKIAADTGLHALIAARGLSPAQIDACLDSEVAQAELAGMTNVGRNADHVHGTPTFFINGREAGVVDWPSLKTRLDAALKGS